MRRLLAILLLLALCPLGLAQTPSAARVFESDAPAGEITVIDRILRTAQRARGLEPARPCSDEVFFRRAHLDVIGTMPEPDAVLAFVKDRSAQKYAKLIDALMQRDEFADYWAMKWCDLLRVKAEFPINLWPNAVQAYHHWIRESIRANKPYDRFVREMLTSSGSNFRAPAVNFYRAVQGRSPSAIAAAVALTFMGTRFETWPEDRRAGMGAFFTRVVFKGTGEWKEEIVQLNPAPTETLEAVFPDGTRVSIAPDKDPRAVFADWLVSPANPWFNRNVVNRAWSWFFARGIIHEPDDIRPDNLPVSEELLVYLENELVDSHYDLRHIFRLILTSQAYRQSPIPRRPGTDAAALFACYPVRRLDAEVLMDALTWIGGTGEGYSSAVPEPFTFIPTSQRAVSLADGSITSPFLEMFGRPSRDTGLESERITEPSDGQRLHMLNSSDVYRRIERSERLRGQYMAAKWNRAETVRRIYLTLLSRHPTPEEEAIARKYVEAPGVNLKQAGDDLAWALVNSKEFLYRH